MIIMEEVQWVWFSAWQNKNNYSLKMNALFN